MRDHVLPVISIGAAILLFDYDPFTKTRPKSADQGLRVRDA